MDECPGNNYSLLENPRHAFPFYNVHFLREFPPCLVAAGLIFLLIPAYSLSYQAAGPANRGGTSVINHGQ